MKYRLKPGCGKHHFTVNGVTKTLKPGDVIDCKESDLASAIDKFEQIEAEQKPPNKLKVVSAGGGKWNVLHPETGKPLNTKPLDKAEAEALSGKTIEQIEAEQK